MRRIVPLLGLLAAGAGRAPAQASSDTTVTAEGFVERTDSGGWEIMLPQPLTVAGRQVNLLTARGKVGPYSRLQDRYVRAVGRVRLAPGEAAFEVTHVQEVEPEGTGRSEIHPSFDQTAIITLSAIPDRFVWRLPDGRWSGVQPLLVYTVLNHGQSELDFMFRTNDILCVQVRPQDGGTPWQISIPAPTRNQERIVIELGGVYRQFVPLPPDAAPRPGRYTARVTLCGIADYTAETQLVVGTP
ncbi:MAG: hypothetical protein E6K55_09120 [Gemmatimonadetes bacterium]|nr:MAG: hypothetical protein DMD67_10255 [Gemmatimonadota bacterium]TLY52491.1 MAG: hypothetical protein E6K55_09120 [Gemmatimonadota bacterium]